MAEPALALVVRSDPSPHGNPTLAFQVAGETLTEKEFTEKYRIVSVGGLTPWSSHSHSPGPPAMGFEVDQAVGLILVEQLAVSGATW